MDFARVELPPDDREFRDRLRSFLVDLVTDDVIRRDRESGENFDEGVHLAFGAAGYLALEWKSESDGGFSRVRRRIWEQEKRRAHVPWVTWGTTAMVARSVAKFGSAELQNEVLPRVFSGEVRLCLGYTEPEGGSDIATCKTRAVRDGGSWLINGSKMFTTGAHNCQYVFLITNTAPDSPKHKSLTMFLVPLNSPGIEIQGLRTVDGDRTNIVYYSDVRISDRFRLGGVNDGWTVLRGPLDEEHSFAQDRVKLGDPSPGAFWLYTLDDALNGAIRWACTTTRSDGSRPIDDRMVRYRLGAVAMHREAGLVTPGPMGRVKASDALVRGAAELMDLVGSASLLSEGGPDAEVTGAIESAHRFAQGTATYGGTVEVFHGIIAQHVLGLPRPIFPGSKRVVAAKREPAAA